MVNYSARYDELALGKKPANLGNIILGVIVAALLLGGGFFVLQREGLINVSFEDPKKIVLQKKYPADVVELLPAISKLKSDSRQALKNILGKPKVAADLFTSIDRLTQENALEEETAAAENTASETDPSESEG
jgi:hypothetical protein